MSKFIPLSEPYLDKFDLNSVSKVIKNNWVSSAGKEITKFESLVSNYTKSKYTVACMNGTSALHISLKIVGVKNGVMMDLLKLEQKKVMVSFYLKFMEYIQNFKIIYKYFKILIYIHNNLL